MSDLIKDLKNEPIDFEHKEQCVPVYLRPFYNILRRLLLTGNIVESRGLETIEAIDFRYTLPPRVRFMNFTERKLKLDYVKQEFVWYLRADSHDTSIAKLATMWRDLINRDGTINSNYGRYLFAPDTAAVHTSDSPSHASNFHRVVNTLTADPGSRRATIAILDNKVLCSQTKDYPCTVFLNFLIRENKLHMFVRMRSQDAIFGMGNDAPCFSLTHELVWCALLRAYPQLELGPYHHSSDSFHVYSRHYEMLAKILRLAACEPEITSPHMKVGDDVELFKIARRPGLKEAGKSPGLITSGFTQWLITREDTETLLDAGGHK